MYSSCFVRVGAAVLLFAPAFFVSNALAQDEIKIVATDGGGGDTFGSSVAIDGDWMIVGAPFDDDRALLAGSAYIFRRQGEAWVQEAKITAVDASQFDFFGVSVSISGNAAIVGAYMDDGGQSTGAAYIFRRNGSNWVQEARLTVDDAFPGQRFGTSVSIDGDRAIVGTDPSIAGALPGAASSTRIGYALSEQSLVVIEIYNALGKKIRTLTNSGQDAGWHSVTWDGRNDRDAPASSGLYFYVVRAGGSRAARSIVLLH